MRAALLVVFACGSQGSPKPSEPTPGPTVTSGSASAVAPAPTSNVAGECTRGDACWVTPDGFRYVHPRPLGTVLRAVRETPDGEVWIAGDDATLLRITGGKHVTRIEVPDVPTYADVVEGVERGAAKDFPGTELMKVSFKGLAATSAHDVWVPLGDKYLSHWDGHAWHREDVDRPASGGDRMIVDGNGAVWAVGRIVVFGQQHVAIADARGVKEGPAIPSDDKLTAIARDGDDVWVGSIEGRIWRSHAGAAFEPVTAPDKYQVRALSAHYLLTDKALYKRTGDQFTQVVEVKGPVSALLELSGDIEWIVGDKPTLVDHGIAREVPIADFMPRGDFVMSLDSDRIEDVDGRSADDVWMVGRAGQILHWDGKQLRELYPHVVEEDLAGIVPLAGDTYLALAQDGTLLTGSAAAGITAHEKAPLDQPMAIARTTAGEIVLAGCHTDMLARGADGTWTKLPKLDGCVRAIGGSDVHHLWAVGSRSMVDGKAWQLVGGAWKMVATGMGENDDLNAVAAASNGDVWIAGDGALFVAKKGGPLKRVAKDDHDDYRGIAIRAPDDVWIATDARDIGSAGTLLHWDGKHFARFDRLTPDGLHAVAVLPSGEVWAVGPEGVATHSSDGRTFKGAQTAADLDSLIALPSGALVGAGRLGAIVQH